MTVDEVHPQAPGGATSGNEALSRRFRVVIVGGSALVLALVFVFGIVLSSNA
jgi:hypothetical protein